MARDDTQIRINGFLQLAPIFTGAVAVVSGARLVKKYENLPELQPSTLIINGKVEQWDSVSRVHEIGGLEATFIISAALTAFFIALQLINKRTPNIVDRDIIRL